ncbi:MAG: ABC transporter substrate-binding protein [Nitrosomonas sp.]|nr:MAG: ABC transporter substrate-binding protein [Nitrosomonas sp.]
MKIKQIINLFVSGLAVFAIAVHMAFASPDAESINPESVVNKLQNGLLNAMQEGQKLGYDGRYKFLEPVIDQTHDIETIIKTILGAAYWTQLDKTQQELIVATFRQLTIATYASQFSVHDDELFKFVEQRELPREQVLVRSQLLTKSDQGTVNFDYVLHQNDGRWQIVNILFDGVSDLAIKRGEYRAIMQKDGFQTLIEKLKEKIAFTRQNP